MSLVVVGARRKIPSGRKEDGYRQKGFVFCRGHAVGHVLGVLPREQPLDKKR